MTRRKGYWYLSGFGAYGFKYRLLALAIKIFYALRLISDEDCKRYANALISAWLIEQAEKNGLKVKEVNLNVWTK